METSDATREALAEAIARSYVPTQNDPDPANHLDTWPDGTGYGEPTEADYRAVDAILASGHVVPVGEVEIEELAAELCNTYYMTVDPRPERRSPRMYDKISEATRRHWRDQARLMRERGWVKDGADS